MRIKLAQPFAILLAVIIGFAAMAGAAPSRAQSSDADRNEQATPGEAAESDSTERLNELLGELRSEPRSAGARRIARQIWQIWTDSGSDTVNLLMEWSSEAIRKKDFATASDLLDQVVTLEPEYVEGWNRRATVHFLQSNYGRSLADIERTLQLEPRHFGALAGLGAILQKTNQDRRALTTWYRILEIYPANEQAQQAVIELEEEFAGEGI